MADDSDERRDQLDAFLQQQGPAGGLDRPAVLTGWAIVTEWMDDTGDRWITKGHSHSLAAWHAVGLHHEAIYGNWGGDE